MFLFAEYLLKFALNFDCLKLGPPREGNFEEPKNFVGWSLVVAPWGGELGQVNPN